MLWTQIWIMITFLFQSRHRAGEQLWQQDLGDSFRIDASTEGLQKVHLKCGADSMHVFLETEEDFTGVLYTKGSFYKQSEPCFRKPVAGKAARSLSMKFALDECLTVQVIVIK